MPLSFLDIARRLMYFFVEQGVTAEPPRVTLTFANITIAHHAMYAIRKEFEAYQMYPVEAGLAMENGELKINGVVFKIEPMK